jgi:hypothetical protein
MRRHEPFRDGSTCAVRKGFLTARGKITPHPRLIISSEEKTKLE